MRLRKALGTAAGSRISTQPRGYLIRRGRRRAGRRPGSRRCWRAARAAARDGSWDAAAARGATRRWSCGGASRWRTCESELLAARELPRLAELRLQALETRIDADLHLGRHAERDRRAAAAGRRAPAAGTPARPADAGPLPRRPAGRGAERLPATPAASWSRNWAPSRARLRELHQRILTADPALAARGSGAGADGRARPVVPRELPAAWRAFHRPRR